MRSHRTIREDLYEYLKDDLPEPRRQKIESHLRTCATCRDELAAMRTAAGLLTEHTRKASDQRGEMYWQYFAGKVVQRIENGETAQEEPGIVQRFLGLVTEHRKPFGIGFASALSLVMIGFALWTLWLSPSEPGMREQSLAQERTGAEVASVRNVSLEARTRDYLDQSKILLIGIMNTDPAGLQELRPLIGRQREVSKTLASESQSLAASLSEPSQRRLRELVADLGVILTEMSNLDSDRDLRGIEIVRSGVERNGILFKINLEQMSREGSNETRNALDQRQRPTI